MKFKVAIAAVLLSVFGLAANTATAQTKFAQCVSEPYVIFDGNVVDAAIATPELSTLVTAVTAAGLGELLATTEFITVYAPTNDAFAALPADVLNAILADVDLLTTVLAYHVTPGRHDARKWIAPTRRNTLADQPVFYHQFNGEQRINNAVVGCTGVRVSNGIVYFIDSVLMPELGMMDGS
jgi:uncharacterized surface protein with fasciclin (FAS1) repeats